MQTQTLDEILVDGDAREAAIINDNRYTEQHREAAAMAIRVEAKAAALATATTMQQTAEAAYQAAEAAVLGHYSAWQESLNPARTQAAQTDAQSLGLASWADVQADVEMAERRADYYTLRAISRQTIPSLRARAAQEYSDMRPFRGEIQALSSRLTESLSACEPDTLKTARAALGTARDNVENVAWAITAAGRRWTVRGGVNPLQPVEPVGIVEHPKDGKMRFSGGRWP